MWTMYPVDANLFSIMAALERNPSDRVSVLALRDWLQEHGGEGSPLLVPVVWVVEEVFDHEGSQVRGIYDSKKLAMKEVEVLVSGSSPRYVYRKVRDDEEGAEWESKDCSFLLYAYKVLTTSG